MNETLLVNGGIGCRLISRFSVTSTVPPLSPSLSASPLSFSPSSLLHSNVVVHVHFRSPSDSVPDSKHTLESEPILLEQRLNQLNARPNYSHHTRRIPSPIPYNLERY